MKKIKILSIPVEVEYTKPILGRLLVFYTFLRLIRLKKCTLKNRGRLVGSFYYLIIPRFVKGSGVNENQ